MNDNRTPLSGLDRKRIRRAEKQREAQLARRMPPGSTSPVKPIKVGYERARRGTS